MSHYVPLKANMEFKDNKINKDIWLKQFQGFQGTQQ